MREFEFIEWIRRQGRFDPKVVAVGTGDDCAVLNVGGEKLLMTTDQVLDGVHFSFSEHGAKSAGRKAAARALSDIAAMAGVPVAMVATVATPKGFSRNDAKAVYQGLRYFSDEFDCPLVGGDVAVWGESRGSKCGVSRLETSSLGLLQISVTILGRGGGIEPVLRSGAQPGDVICVTGELGAAWTTKRHLDFTPRIAEARTLAGKFTISAMIDISDGLAGDLGHIADASGVAAELDASAIPVHADANGRKDPLKAALFDGEDYELLFTLPGDKARRLLETNPLGVKVSRIGVITSGAGMTLLRDKRREKLKPGGWEHKT